MSGNNEEQQNIINKLFNKEPNVREKILIEIEQNWDIKFREFLWKAIEKEKVTKIQRKMVELSIKILSENSIRKLIRFMESGVLKKESVGVVISVYPELETPEIRITLNKSLQRENSKIYLFICRLISSKYILQYPSEELESLLSMSLSNSIPNKFRKEIISNILNTYNYQTELPKNLNMEFIWCQISKDPILAIHVLRNFYPFIVTPKNLAKKDSKKFILLWENWIHDIQSGDRLINPFADNLQAQDKFLIKSLHSKNVEIRSICISILSYSLNQIILSTHYFWKENSKEFSNSIYMQNLYSIWDHLIKSKLDEDFVFLENFGNQIIEEFFKENQDIYSHIQALNIHPRQISAFIFAFLPRTYLKKLAQNDPSENNRLLSFLSLTNQFVWKTPNEQIIGPPGSWFQIIKICLHAIKFETNLKIQVQVTELLFMMVNILIKDQTEFSEFLKSQLIKQLDLSSYTKISIAYPMIFKLNSFLEKNIELELSSVETLPPELTRLMYKELTSNFSNRSLIKILMNLLEMSSNEDKMYFTEYLLSRSKDKNLLNSEIEELHLNLVLDSLSLDEDVGIRTKSQLIKQKINALYS